MAGAQSTDAENSKSLPKVTDRSAPVKKSSLDKVQSQPVANKPAVADQTFQNVPAGI